MASLNLFVNYKLYISNIKYYKDNELNLESFMNWVNVSNPNQPEFIQAVHEIAQHVVP